MRKAGLFLFCLLSSLVSMAQESSKDETEKHRIGLNLGTTTGVGLAYQYFPKNFGIQVAFLPVVTTGTDTFIDFGATALWVLDRSSHGNILWFNSYNFIYVDELFFNIGIGPGFTIDIGPVSPQLMVGYGVYGIGTDISLLPTIETGLYYRF